MSEKKNIGELYVNHIYPTQCCKCKLEGTEKCKLVIESCECVNCIIDEVQI